MAKIESPDKLLESLIVAMGEEQGKRFYHFRNRFLEICFLWKDYDFLFVQKKDRVELLEKAAPRFFGNVQRIFRDRILLDLAKLIDPVGSGQKINVSIQSLFSVMDKDLIDNIQDDLDLVVSDCESIKEHRNKRIGHNDLITAERIRKAKLQKVPLKEVGRVFAHMERIFNAIQKHYQCATTPFVLLEEDPSTRCLLYVLYDGLAENDKRWQRLSEGIETSDDAERRFLRL